MKKLCLFVVIVSMLATMFSTFTIVASADSWKDGYSLVYSQDGSKTITPADASSGFTFTKVACLPQTENNSGYHWSGTPTSDMVYDSHGKTYISPNLPKLIADYGSNPKYIAIEFDVLFEYSGNSIGFRGKQTNANNITFFKVEAGKDVPIHNWVHINAMIGADGKTNTVDVYANGNKIKSIATESGASGFAQFGWLMPYIGSSGVTSYGAYLDNINILFGNNDFTNEYTTPIIESVNTFKFNTSTKEVEATKNTTVREILSDITVTNGAKAFVINDNMEVAADTVAIKNTYKIALSLNGIYNYYGIAYDADKLIMGFNGSSYTANTGTNPQTMKPMINSDYATASFTINSKAPQKNENDATIKAYCPSAEKNISNGSMYLLSKMDTVIGKNKYKYVTLEYDVFFGCANTGTYFRFKQYSNDSTSSASMNIFVGTGSAEVAATADTIASVTNLNTDTWYKVAIVFGADGTNDNCCIYVNDSLAASGKTKATGLYGVSTTAPNGYFSMAAKKGGELEIYLDNINVYAGNVGYQPGTEAYITETESENFTLDLEQKVITPVNRTLNAGDFAKEINTSDNAQEIYVLSNIKTKAPADTILLCNCEYVAVLSNDGIWNYYTIDSDLKIDYHGLMIDLMYTYVGDDAQTLRVYTDISNPLKNNNVSETTIICFYNEDNKLINVSAQNNITSGSAQEMFTKDVTIPDNASSFRILSWSNFDKLIPLTSTQKITINDRLFFILKFDDLMFDSNSASKYDKWLSFIDNYGIHATAGAIAKTFNEADLTVDANAQRVAMMKGWISKGHEIWCHGYTTDDAEFKESNSEENMKDILDTCFATIKRVLDYDMHSFGSPGNIYCQKSCNVLNNYEPITSVFMVKGDNMTFIQKPDYERIIYSEKVIDGGTRVVSDYFKTNFISSTSKRTLNDYAITQIHPTWKNDDDYANFVDMFKFMLTQNVCFMTPTEYTNYMNNIQ